MEKKLNHYVSIYKEQLQKGDILVAYDALVKFTQQLRTNFLKNLSDDYKFTGILHGYLDYTYFYYTNDFLKTKKLKLGLVLNHVEMQFEVWLLGNTKDIQEQYWKLLQSSKWNKNKTEMSEYSVLEAVIEDNPDFNNLELLAKTIEEKVVIISEEIIQEIQKLG